MTKPTGTVLGYSGDGTPIIEEDFNGRIVTRAFILCSLCVAAISPVGGPRYNSICVKCYEKTSIQCNG